MLLQGIIPLAIEVGNQKKLKNKKKEDMNQEDLEDNIEKVAIEGNLSPKQIQTLSANHGKQHKKGKNSNGSTMQTMSHTLKSKSK